MLASVSATRWSAGESVPRRSPRSRICCSDSSPLTYSTGRFGPESRSSAERSSVLFPIPGSPASNTTAPGTSPPPSARSSSPMPVLSRRPGESGTWSMGSTGESPRPPARADCSSTEPNAPQPPHLPNHFAVRKPHCLHTCWIAIFAMVESCPQGPTCMLRASRVMTRSRGARLVLPILFVTVFIDLVGFGIIIPFLAYYVESFGARAAVVGLLMSSYSLAQFLFAPVWGRLSDRIGRRPILLLGLTGSVVGFTLFGLAGTLGLLFVGRVRTGIFGATIPTAQAAVADVTAPQDRARGMGLIGAAIGLGFILGPALGGVLSNLSSVLRLPLFEHNPYALPCLASAALAALNLIAAAFFLPESLPHDRRGSHSGEGFSRITILSRGLTDRRLRLLVLVYFLFMLGFTMMEATLTLFIERRIGAGDHAQLVRRVGYLFGFIGIIQVGLQGGLVGRLARLFGERKLLIAGCAVTALALAALPFAASWTGIYGCAFGLACGHGLSQPSVASLISRAAPPQTQGGALGISQSAASLARVLGPALGRALFEQIAPGAPYVVAAGLSIAAVVCAAPGRRDA